MKNKRNTKLLLLKSFFCTLLFVILTSGSTYAKEGQDASSIKEQQLEEIKVGFFKFNGYHPINEDGGYSGYGYELLQHLVGYTNWKYEFVGYDKSWNEMQDMLEKGEIDLLTSAQKTEERLQRFDFSDKAIGTSAAILTVRAGNTDYVHEDYTNWNGIRVGLLNGSSRNEDFAEFAEKTAFPTVRFIIIILKTWL